MANLSFLGRGLMRPFRRDKKNDFATEEGVALVSACVGQVLGTKADSANAPGELPWRTEFGSRFHLLRHRGDNGPLRELAEVYAMEALTRWEPRVRVVRATVERSTAAKTVVVRIRFNVVDSGGRVLATEQEVPVTLALAA